VIFDLDENQHQSHDNSPPDWFLGLGQH
jgi:hypothetical protein